MKDSWENLLEFLLSNRSQCLYFGSPWEKYEANEALELAAMDDSCCKSSLKYGSQ